jgi:uncharacterized protein YqhQ
LEKLLDVGGQAVLEGVMMRGPSSMVIAVRRADGGIVVRDDRWVPFFSRYPLLKLPLLRGATIMVEALLNGTQALAFSAEVAAPEGEGGAKPAGTKGAIAVSLVFSLVLGAALFIYLPHAVASVAANLVRGLPLLAPAPVQSPLFHLVAGAVKLSVFLGYVAAIRRIPDIRRVFQYHGAEHKSIHAYEAREELTVANARKWPKAHPRCGTSFLVFVILISVFFFAGVFPLLPLPQGLSGFQQNLLQASVKVPLMVPIAGLSYEFIRWAGRHKGHPVLHFLSIPGLLVQRLTTLEPDDGQLEVALVSLRRTLQREGGVDEAGFPNCSFVAAPQAS